MKPMLLRYFLLCCGFLLVSACSQVPPKKPSGSGSVTSSLTKQQAWNNRQKILARKSKWGLSSKVALRYRDEHWTFGLNWIQASARQYVMQIKNPVTGSILAKLTKNNQGVTLLSDDGKTYRDVNEERLLTRQSGVQLPLKGMQYWIRGLPSPAHKTNKLVLDSRGRPQIIYQAGWVINYSGYLNSNVDAMPRKVVITRQKDNVYLKMIAKQWR